MLLPTWVVLVYVGIVGAILASYANVVAYRVPLGMSTARPPSACPACGHRVRPWDNIPVVSWLVLRGRCRDCRAPISVRYALVEAAGAGLFVLVGGVLSPSLGWWATLPALALVAGAVPLSLIDLDTMTLPDKVMRPWAVVVAAAVAVAAVGSGDPSVALRAVAGGAILFASYFVVAVAYPAGMGFGDVKLAAPLGAVLAFYGWPNLLVGALAAFVVGLAAVGVAAGVGRKVGRKSEVPFGPAMCAGALVGILAGGQVFDIYLRVAGLS